MPIKARLFDSNLDQNADWLTNSSFQVVSGPSTTPIEIVQSDDGDDVAVYSVSSEGVDDSVRKAAKKRSKKKKKKRRKEKRAKLDARKAASDQDDEKEHGSNIEFTGKEDHYVDKTPCHREIDKRDVARYAVKVHMLGTRRMMYHSRKEKPKRYFMCKFGDDSGEVAGCVGNDANAGNSTSTKIYRMTEDEFIAKTKTFNKSLAEDSSDIDTCLEFVRFQQSFYMKMTKVQIAERKMEILNRAQRSIVSGIYRHIGVGISIV